MPDAWRAYLEMALGLTEAPRKRATKAVGDLVNRGGATAAQLQGLVEDLMSAGMANREALTNIVRYEVDKALGVVGLATAEEVTELTTRVHDLEKKLRAAQAKADGATEPAGSRLDQPAPLPRKVAKKAVAKKAVAKKAVQATPNAMPSAGTKPATPVVNVAAVQPEAVPTTPASAPVKKAAKKAVAKKAVKKAPGLAESPVAAVKDAAETTELPPARPTAAKKAPAKRAPAKKAATKAAPTNPEA
jgi:polyhydroxyalkanoate synthesis regulator phasin